jgi:hypothetical protein
MDWTQRDGVWVSGPYTIELIEPGLWALTRRSDGSATPLVEVDESRWTGRSLQRMKRRAEEIESDHVRVRDRNRHLKVAAAALVVFVMVIGASGPVAATLAISAGGTLIYGLLRAVDDTMRRRPWDSINEIYQ